jgi:hypothetical protein
MRTSVCLGELRSEHWLPAACIQQAVVIVRAHGRAGGVYRRTGAEQSRSRIKKLITSFDTIRVRPPENRSIVFKPTLGKKDQPGKLQRLHLGFATNTAAK